MAMMAKEKLDEIRKGTIPDGFKELSRTDTSVTLCPKDAQALEGITINSLDLSITYEGFNFNLKHA